MFEDFRLRVFQKVAECGNFTAASRELGISQPAVTQNIALLEKLVGEPLFLRSRGSVSLTDKGKLFLSYVEKILYWYEKTEAVVINKTEAPGKPVLLSLDSDKNAEISVIDGEINIRIL